MVLDWQAFGQIAGKIALAYLLAIPLGWDREKESRGVGLRTFPLVAIASCGYVLLGADTPDANSRVLQGLLTGIGFIGAGAIMNGAGGVQGTATAASIWNTGVIGASVGMGRYEIGIFLSLINLVTLRLLRQFKAHARNGQQNGGDEPGPGGIIGA